MRGATTATKTPLGQAIGGPSTTSVLPGMVRIKSAMPVGLPAALRAVEADDAQSEENDCSIARKPRRAG